MRIISIDPGYERLGIAIIEKNKKEELLFSECFKTKASLPFFDRLEIIGHEVERVIKEFSPKALAIENLFIETNQKTAMRVAEVRLFLPGAYFRVEIYEYPPKSRLPHGYGKNLQNTSDDYGKNFVSGAESIKQDDEWTQ